MGKIVSCWPIEQASGHMDVGFGVNGSDAS